MEKNVGLGKDSMSNEKFVENARRPNNEFDQYLNIISNQTKENWY